MSTAAWRDRKAIDALHEYAIAHAHGVVEPGYEHRRIDKTSALNIVDANRWINGRFETWRREGRINRFDHLKIDYKPDPWNLSRLRKMWQHLGEWDIIALAIQLNLNVPEEKMENIRQAIREIVKHELRVIFGQIAIATQKETEQYQPDTPAEEKGPKKYKKRVYTHPETKQPCSKKEVTDWKKAHPAAA